MPNNELNSIRIAVKNGETNESNPVNIVTSAENVEVKTDSFRGNILNYIDSVTENLQQKTEPTPEELQEKRVNVPHNSDIKKNLIKYHRGMMQPDNGTIISSTEDTYSTYSIKDTVEAGVIPTIIDQGDKIAKLAEGSGGGDGINENNLLSFLDDRFLDSISFAQDNSIFYKALKNNDEEYKLTLKFNFKPGVSWSDEIDINALYSNIREIIYCEIPFNIYYKLVPGSMRRVNNNGSISLYVDLKLIYREGFFRVLQGRNRIAPIKMISVKNNEYEYILDYAIRTGNNIMIKFGPAERINTKFLRYDAMTDFDYSTLTQPTYTSLPIFTGMNTLVDSNISSNADKINWYNYARFSSNVDNEFLEQMIETLAIVENVKNDNTGKYVLKISNSIRYDIGTSFDTNTDRYGYDKKPRKNFGNYTLYLPVFLDVKKAYIQINDGPMSELSIYTESDARKEVKKDVSRCYMTAKSSNVHLPVGNYVEWGVPAMHVQGAGYPEAYYKTKYAVPPKNKVTIYITEFELSSDYNDNYESIPL